MITVTGKEMVVTRRRTRWMRTVLQSRTTRFAAATPTCKLHDSYSRLGDLSVVTLHCSRCNSSGVAEVSVVALTAVVMAMLHY